MCFKYYHITKKCGCNYDVTINEQHKRSNNVLSSKFRKLKCIVVVISTKQHQAFLRDETLSLDSSKRYLKCFLFATY